MIPGGQNDFVTFGKNVMKERKNFYFCDFLEFMHYDENIILSDNDVEESNGGGFKN